MIVLLFSMAAFVFALGVCVYVATEDLRCDGCGRFRRRASDGWRRCFPCRRGWRID